MTLSKKCIRLRLSAKTVDKSGLIGLFSFPPTGNGNNQPYPLLLIKYELKLPSEATPGHLTFRFRFNQCERYVL